MLNKLNDKKFALISSIILTVISAALTIFTLIITIKSYSYYDDGYGVSIEFNADYIVYFVSSVTLLVFSIISLKNQRYDVNTAIISGGIIEVLLSFYPLGIFFKAISKHKPFNENVHYLIIGLIFLILLVLTIIYTVKYLKNKKEAEVK